MFLKPPHHGNHTEHSWKLGPKIRKITPEHVRVLVGFHGNRRRNQGVQSLMPANNNEMKYTLLFPVWKCLLYGRSFCWFVHLFVFSMTTWTISMSMWSQNFKIKCQHLRSKVKITREINTFGSKSQKLILNETVLKNVKPMWVKYKDKSTKSVLFFILSWHKWTSIGPSSAKILRPKVKVTR